MIAALCGIPAVCGYAGPVPKGQGDSFNIQVAIFNGVGRIIGSPVPPLVFCAGWLVAPARFAATTSYLREVCLPPQNPCTYAQDDAEDLYTCLRDGASETHVLLGTPKVVVPLYIRYINPRRGFGVFTAGVIGSEQVLQDGLRVPTAECIGTYGGRVCDKREAIHKKGLYRLQKISLQPLGLGKPYVYYSLPCLSS